MIALSVAKLKMFSPESDIFLWIKLKRKKNFFVESLDQCRRLEVREKTRKVMLFVTSLPLSDHKVLHNISSSSFFRFRSDFLARISYFKFLEFKEFNKTIIPFALVGYETGYGYAPRWLFTISYPTRAHGIIVNCNLHLELTCSWRGHVPLN